VYALLRVVLPIAVALAILLILIIPGLLVLGSSAIIEVGLHEAFLNATGAMMVLGICVEVLVGLIALALAVLVGICLQGPVGTWVRQFALLFYGGRYPALGAILYPPPVTPILPTAPVSPLVPGIG
jgi:hypothetical protein